MENGSVYLGASLTGLYVGHIYWQYGVTRIYSRLSGSLKWPVGSGGRVAGDRLIAGGGTDALMMGDGFALLGLSIVTLLRPLIHELPAPYLGLV